jgi:hypothetical protein
MVGKFVKHGWPWSLIVRTFTIGRILKADTVDELLKHWISSCIDMFGKRQIDLPSESTIVSHIDPETTPGLQKY